MNQFTIVYECGLVGAFLGLIIGIILMACGWRL